MKQHKNPTLFTPTPDNALQPWRNIVSCVIVYSLPYILFSTSINQFNAYRPQSLSAISSSCPCEEAMRVSVPHLETVEGSLPSCSCKPFSSFLFFQQEQLSAYYLSLHITLFDGMYTTKILKTKLLLRNQLSLKQLFTTRFMSIIRVLAISLPRFFPLHFFDGTSLLLDSRH